jgi:hypothetical protein
VSFDKSRLINYFLSFASQNNKNKHQKCNEDNYGANYITHQNPLSNNEAPTAMGGGGLTEGAFVSF